MNTSPRQQGFKRELIHIEHLLGIEHALAEETFMLFREKDAYYADERTDLTLGRKDALEVVLSEVRRLLAK